MVSEKKSNATFAHKRYKNVIYILKALESVQEYTVLEAAKNQNLYLKKKIGCLDLICDTWGVFVGIVRVSRICIS